MSDHQKPSVGRIVHYKLTEYDAGQINGERAASPSGPGLPAYAKVKRGNQPAAGEVYPALVVRIFDPSVTTANLQVFLDGNDTYWATSRQEGDEPGQWSWPPRA